MAAADIRLLRSVEVRLLRCTLSPLRNPVTFPSSRQDKYFLCTAIESTLCEIERGNYAGALTSAAARKVFPFLESWKFADSAESAGDFYREVERCVSVFLAEDVRHEFWLDCLDSGMEEDEEEGIDVSQKVALVLCLGVAAFLVFFQRNFTGPTENSSPFPLFIPEFNQSKRQDEGQWGVWARNQLTLDGSDIFGKFSLLQYIVYARILLKSVHHKEAGSVSWWLCRLMLAHQRILDNLSSSLYDSLKDVVDETLCRFGTVESVNMYWAALLCQEESSTIVSMAHLEAGIFTHVYAWVDSSGVHLNAAEQASGLHLSVTGILGFRTIHQVESKPQLVLVTGTEEKRNIKDGFQTSEILKKCSETSETSATHDDCDILMIPKLVESGGNIKVNGNYDLSSKTSLTEAQKAIILAKCLHTKKKNPDDELSGWEMAPFIEAIDSEQNTCFSIRCLCDILRIRWEATRSRTKQRALMMMDKLVDLVCGSSPAAAERIYFSLSVYIPTVPALRKEYGRLLVSNGLIGEALLIFEDLELWDDLIHCYRLLEKKSAAVDLIRARLAETPEDPRLWCSLGDVETNDAHYHKALEISNNRSTRAMRSLARSAYNRGDYETSKVLWESALELNSLFPDGWFALGAAALKARDTDKALDAFTRSVQVDPDNGEAWNNIACLHMMKNRSKESFVAFKEALKFRRNSWQLWENYGHVAMDIGNIAQAMEAIRMVLELSNNKRIETELLERIMQYVEEDLNISSLNEMGSIEGNEKSRETEFLVSMLGNILQQIVRKSDTHNVWGIYARWHKVKGDLPMCAEALLKQVRSYQGSDLWRDRERFKKFAISSLQLCKVNAEIASSTGQRRELLTAEMHLKNTLKQGVDFSDTEEFRDLEACLQEIQSLLSKSTP